MMSAAWARKLAVAAVAAGFAGGVSQGFAASLGTGTGGLGATSKIVGACGSGLTFGYTTTFDPGISGYAVNGIEVSNIPAGCLDKSLTATFYGSDANATGSAVSATLPTTGTTQTIPIDPSSNTIDAGQFSGVSVVVS
jgi:hypothetical protein